MSAENYRWRCRCCGEEQLGLPLDAAFEAPVDWAALDECTRAASLLDEDFCRVRYPGGETERFIRCLLLLPVPELGSEFGFGVWMSVSERSWNIYEAGFEDGVYEQDGCFGYLMHEIPGFEGSAGLGADVWFRPGGLRPNVILHECDHPLYDAQQTGVSLAQVERWAALMLAH